MEVKSHDGKDIIFCKDTEKEKQVRTLLTNMDLLQTEDIEGSNNGDMGQVKVNKLVRNFGF